MVSMREIAYTDFILVEADQVAVQVAATLWKLDVAAVIVRHQQGPELCHYLFLAEDFRVLTDHPDSNRPLEIALGLCERWATPILTVDADAETAPDSAVVMEGNQVVAFYDVRIDPTTARQGTGQGGILSSTTVARAFQTDFPEEVLLGQTTALLVSLVKLVNAANGRTAQPVVVDIGSQVEIMVQAQQGFVVEGAEEGTITITDDAETLPLKFQLRSTEVGPGRIRVLCFRNGQPLGGIILTPTVLPESQAQAGPRARIKQGIETRNSAEPDLTLRIFERIENGRRKLTLELKALDHTLGLQFTPYGPVDLRVDPLQYFQEFFKDIGKLTIKTPEERAIAAHQLQAAGARLFRELVPTDLRRLLWTLRDRIDTLQLYSDEPWIPWELLRLVGEEHGSTVEGPYLCEAFAMTRWFPGIARKPRLRVSRIGTVIPSNSGLVFTQKERDYLHALATDQRKVEDIPAKYLDIVEAMSAGTYDCLHFSGHAASDQVHPDNAYIRLESGVFKAGLVEGRVRNLGQARPLVFLNACQTGQAAMSLTGIGGWAKSFIGAGAGGFVGSLWNVRDKAAYEFAKALYGHLLAGMPVGQAVRASRTAVKPIDDVTWLAYTVFADPMATVEGVNRADPE